MAMLGCPQRVPLPSADSRKLLKTWSGRPDSNRRPPGPELWQKKSLSASRGVA